ncbi:hypothetical protein FQR65_LT20461 [Abscondita terminalis]|nr:hypothetical protein FQR65_LT20461 [Abscondita terminalis]
MRQRGEPDGSPDRTRATVCGIGASPSMHLQRRGCARAPCRRLRRHAKYAALAEERRGGAPVDQVVDGRAVATTVPATAPGCDMDAMRENDVTTRSEPRQSGRTRSRPPRAVGQLLEPVRRRCDQGRATPTNSARVTSSRTAEPTGAVTDEELTRACRKAANRRSRPFVFVPLGDPQNRSDATSLRIPRRDPCFRADW